MCRGRATQSEIGSGRRIASVFGTCSPITMCRDENNRKPARNATVCSIASLKPSRRNRGSSSAATAGSPTQPRPSEAMVIPSWQAAR